MKKRIGTKLYDTEKAAPVLPDLGLYKQGQKQTYFIFDGVTITPLSYEDAAAMLQTAGASEVLQHKPDAKGRAKIAISTAAADHLAAYCRERGVTQREIIEGFIYSLKL